MIAWSRRRTLIAGAVLIVLTNAIALSGVAYNRSGSPDSTLKLTQRELPPSYSTFGTAENSGLALSLRWRAPLQDRADSEPSTMSYWLYGGSLVWLDKSKLSELGFDVSRPADTDRGRRFYDRALPREVLLVLELDGEASRQALEAVRAYAARQDELRAANPGKKEFEDRARRGAELVKQEERDNSRLFVIDAGLDIAVLRAKYPDSSKYAIVRGLVRPRVGLEGKTPQPSGYVSDLSINDVNVPKDLRKDLPETRHRYALPSSPYEITLAIGKRLEPWITSVSRPAAP